MPVSKSVDKAARVAEKKRLRNRLVRTRTRTAVGGARRLISTGDVESARQGVAAAVSSIDRAVSKGIFHRNKGARLKSRLASGLKARSAEAPGPEPAEEEKE
ncbi:MAG: 30S ribosomal protein S20 [Chloroflexota bacterium]|nr:30S ribosomal protein S20 [Chloroflexota bacterium]